MNAQVKRVLRPFRRLLRPFRRFVRTTWSRAVLRSRFAAFVSDATDAITRRSRPLRPLRLHEIAHLVATDPWYRHRGGYMSVACGVAGEIIEGRQLRTALELGPHLQSMIVGSDTMELFAHPLLQANGKRIVHDATSVPWPVGDREYGLFMALQVFEHLGTSQPKAFLEVRRVAQNAIISLPIDWEMADPANCHHRLSHERVLSWFAPVVPTRVVVGNPGSRKRLVYIFEDLPGPDPDAKSSVEPVRDHATEPVLG
jgi:hypothetical protein